MIIHYLSSTYSSHGVLTSRFQICASILLAEHIGSLQSPFNPHIPAALAG